MKKTPDFIQELARQNSVRRQGPSILRFFATWILGVLFIAGAVACLMKLRSDLAVQKSNPQFVLTSFLWISGAITASVVAYLSSLPGRLKRRQQILSVLPLLVLLVSLILRLPMDTFAAQLSEELNPQSSACGIIMLAFSGMSAAWTFWLLRNGAATRLALTGAWVALSAAGFGGFLIQMHCPRDNALHLILWHFMPVAALIVAGMLASRRWLRW